MARASRATRLTGTETVTSVQGIRMMGANLAVTAALAERELGARFRPLKETLRDVVTWTRARSGAGAETSAGHSALESA